MSGASAAILAREAAPDNPPAADSSALAAAPQLAPSDVEPVVAKRPEPRPVHIASQKGPSVVFATPGLILRSGNDRSSAGAITIFPTSDYI